MELIIITLLGFLTQDQAAAKDPPNDERQARLEKFRQEARDYEISTTGMPETKVQVRLEPILHWSNPTRVGEDGAVFLWLREGRPEVIGSLFSCRDNRNIARVHELHSLSREPLRATFRGDVVWAPVMAGMPLNLFVSAPEPADSAPLRLTQMRSLAREFSAQSVDPNAGRIELRLMPQPLYRYEATGQTIVDGALFAFAHGTDPEVLLAIEARREGGTTKWWYGLARFSDLNLHVQHRDKEIWSVELARALRTDIRREPEYQGNIYVSFRAEALLID